jgi:hypothetical protein
MFLVVAVVVVAVAVAVAVDYDPHSVTDRMLTPLPSLGHQLGLK